MESITGNVLTTIGSLIVFLLGLFLYMIEGLRNDMQRMDIGTKQEIKDMTDLILDRVERPFCVREMDMIRADLKDTIKDVKDIVIRGGS